MAAHRYWRIRAFEYGDGVLHVGNINPVLSSVAAVEFRATAGVAPTYPLTGTASARAGTAANAFDGNPATSCDAPSTAVAHDFWAFDSGTNSANWIEPVEVMIQARNAADAATRTPKAFAVEWSDNNTAWNLHCVRDLGGGWTAGAARTIAVAPEPAATPATGFPTFRLRVLEVNGGETARALGLAQLEFRSAAGVAENHNAARANGAFGAADSGATRVAANAFDGDPASFYQSSASVGQGMTFGFSFPPGTKRKPVELFIQAPATDGRLAPTLFNVDATEDGGGTWTTLGTFRTLFFASGEARAFKLRTAESNDSLFSQLEIEAAYVPSKNLDPRVSLLVLEVAYIKSTAPARRRPLYVMG